MKKILVIDDEPDITEIISLYSSKLGYSADVCYSWDEVVRKLNGNDYKAIFCDLKMPGVNGIEMYNRVSRMRPELAKNFILVTGAILDIEAEEIVKKHDIMVFKKPFNYDAICEIFSILEKRNL